MPDADDPETFATCGQHTPPDPPKGFDWTPIFFDDTKERAASLIGVPVNDTNSTNSSNVSLSSPGRHSLAKMPETDMDKTPVGNLATWPLRRCYISDNKYCAATFW